MNRLVQAAMVGLTVGVIAGACGGSYAPCSTDAQCNGGICLPVKICAHRCTREAECGTGERCSAAGGCIPNKDGWCAVTADCPSGETCLPTAVCSGSALPDGGRRTSDGGAQSCGGERFQATRTEANVLILLDHSCSMMDPIGNTGTLKWNAATQAVRQVTTQFSPQIRFGLAMFSYNQVACNSGGVLVPVGDNTAPQIASSLPGQADGRMTPLAAAIQVAGAAPGLADPTRANYVLLITDGMENCGGDPVTQVQTLFGRSIRSYIVGFGADVDATNLNQMAVKGGTARMGTQRYYQADSAPDLNAALQSIAQGAVGCDFALAQTPPDITKLYVAINGQLVPRDPSRQAGWEYTQSTNRLTLYGPACDALSNTPGARLDIVYGCPDPTLIEQGGHGDGGFDFGIDAGDIN